MSDDAITAGFLQNNDAITPSAGALLRQARQARGLHIAALATSIKVSPQKLELLETDKIDQLPGDAFARALAQTVCRFLKIDAAPIMALLPQSPAHGLDQMSRGLNQPFHENSGRRDTKLLHLFKNPVLLGALFLLLAAAGVYLAPKNWLHDYLPKSAGNSEVGGIVTQTVPNGILVTDDVGTPMGVGVTSSTTVVAATAPAPLAPALPPSIGLLQLKALDASWAEVLDKNGSSLLSRNLQTAEIVNLDGEPPLKVKIGNASKVQLLFKGQPVDLSAVTTRGNVAKIELK
jgi:cytoskeleton protein RodZ